MKSLLPVLLVGIFLGACGRQSPSTSSVQDDDVRIPELTDYIATIKDDAAQATFTEKCATRIEAISGVTVNNVLDILGVVSFTSIPEQSAKVAKLGCVLSVEKDLTNSADPSTRVGN